MSDTEEKPLPGSDSEEDSEAEAPPQKPAEDNKKGGEGAKPAAPADAKKKVPRRPARSREWVSSKQDIDTLSPFDIDWGVKVGEGTYGEVYKGTLWGQGVAIKRVKLWNADADIKQTLVADFHAEINVLRSLRHPNVVSFLGACYEEPHLCIVCELCDNGSLWDLIKKTRAQKKRFSTRKVLEFGMQMARGLNWLHHKGVMHRDLKPANILVSKHFTLQIADFGLASVKPREKQHDEAYAAGVAGTRFYMAPEVIQSQAYNTKADVFSYAIVMGELVSGVAPWETGTARKLAPDIYDQSVVQGYRPTLPPNTVPELKLLISNCWHGDPEQRPAMDEVVDALALIQQTITIAEDDLLEDLPDKVASIVKEKIARSEELEEQLAQATQKILKLEEELAKEKNRVGAGGPARQGAGVPAAAGGAGVQGQKHHQAAENAVDASLELSARHWLQALCQEDFREPYLQEALQSGVRLCRAMNKIQPFAVRDIQDPALPQSRFENITSFIKAARAYGIKEADMFSANDLFTNAVGVMPVVITSLMALAVLASRQSPYLPPFIIVANAIPNWPGPVFSVQLPVRGFLWKPGKDNTGFKRRFFILGKNPKGTRGMFYYEKEQVPDPSGYANEKASAGSFPVEGALLRLFPTGTWPRGKNAYHFGIIAPTKDKRMYLLEAESQEERVRWMHALLYAGAAMDRSPYDRVLATSKVEGHIEKFDGDKAPTWKMRYVLVDPHRRELMFYEDLTTAKKNKIAGPSLPLLESTLIEPVAPKDSQGRDFVFGVTPGHGAPGDFVLGVKKRFLFSCNDENNMMDFVRACREVADPEGLREPKAPEPVVQPGTLRKNGPSTLQARAGKPDAPAPGTLKAKILAVADKGDKTPRAAANNRKPRQISADDDDAEDSPPPPSDEDKEKEKAKTPKGRPASPAGKAKSPVAAKKLSAKAAPADSDDSTESD